LSRSADGELVFVAVASSFTKRGFVGSASYGGRPVDIEFDDREAGVFLTPDMSKRLGVRKGSKVLLIVEAEDEPVATEAKVAGVSPKPRLSSARVYYEVGKEGGAILRIRKA